MSDTDMAYCARRPECGCVYACFVDLPELRKEHAKEMARWMREGAQVDHLTVAEVRALPWGWPCEHMQEEQRRAKATRRAKASVSKDQLDLAVSGGS